MKKPQTVLAALLFVLPAGVKAQQPNAEMTHKINLSPASQEYMSGMQKMHSGMMDALKDQDADRAFARGMTAHHRGAIAMAETELKYGKDPEMRKMAENVIKAQKSEIEQMDAWLKK